jgi:Mrp family chromosome partitioning ATPase
VRGDVSLATAAVSTSVPGLYFLQAGDARQNPVAVLEDERLLKLIDAARREFGAVLIDAPPRLPVVDAAILERLATLVLFVVRAEWTPRASVQRGLRGVGLPVGLILNGVKRDVYRSQFGSDPSEPPYPDRRQ